MDKEERKDKQIIKAINFKDFLLICSELQIVQKATEELFYIANSITTDDKIRVSIYKWIIEMAIGKPKQIDLQANSTENGITKYEVVYREGQEDPKEGNV